MLQKLSVWFCREFHTKMTRPVNGHYSCLECGKKYKSPFN